MVLEKTSAVKFNQTEMSHPSQGQGRKNLCNRNFGKNGWNNSLLSKAEPYQAEPYVVLIRRLPTRGLLVLTRAFPSISETESNLRKASIYSFCAQRRKKYFLPKIQFVTCF